MRKFPFFRGPKGRGTAFFVLVGFLSVFLLGAVFVSALALQLPSPERITDRDIVESTKIYDRTGQVLLYEIHGEEKRTVIPLAEIPEFVKQATIAAEDDTFYRHMGLDGRGIVRAILKNLAEGDIIQGGSTITQQLVKNSLLTSERTFTRKIKEAILAVMVEKKFSKDEILELYLNQIPYGANAYGIESAAQTFFAKPAQDLTLPEAALLAALPKAPTYYSPHGSHKEELYARKDWIIERLVQKNIVTAAEGGTAKAVRISVAAPKQNIRAPHFAFYVREYLNKKYGEEFVERGGLKVITTADWKLQEEAEKIVKEGAEQNEKAVGAANASLVSIDPRTGEILAMVGSRDYWEKPRPEGCNPGIDCKFDPHVNISGRPLQPGSAFKPFVYATALKKGYTPETVLFDAFTEFNSSCNPDGTPGPSVSDPRTCYHPRNYDGNFRGPVTLRQSLAQSLNVPSVKLLYLTGIEDSINTAKDLGITTIDDPARLGLTLVLGGAEVTLLEMTSAFGVFSQDGILHPPTAVLRIENSQGVALEEKKEISAPVLDSNVARTINDLLSDNDARIPMFNPRSSLYFPNRRVAAKTGTTQDYRSAWVIGYTPSLVTGVWAGNNDNTSMTQSAASVMVAAPVWRRFMDTALAQMPPEEFSPPERYLPEKLVMRGAYRSGPIVKIDKISGKLATALTPPELIEEKSFGEVKSILSFVRKNDPLGDPPVNAGDDPQFNNWQAGIENWLKTNPLMGAEAPKEFDDLHLPEKKPKIQLILPSGGQKVQEINLRVQSTFPLREVSLFINDELRNAKTAPIISELISFVLDNSLAPGSHRIKITAYDAVGNKEEVTQELLVTGY